MLVLSLNNRVAISVSSNKDLKVRESSLDVLNMIFETLPKTLIEDVLLLKDLLFTLELPEKVFELGVVTLELRVILELRLILIGFSYDILHQILRCLFSPLSG